MHVNNTPPSQLQIVSHNVQGLNSALKMRKLFKLFQSQKSDILLLQKTHFPKSYNPPFIQQHYPQFYLSNAENKKE